MKIKFWLRLNAVLGVSLVLLLCAAVPSGADGTRYMYDDAGRLFGVVDEQGKTSIYRYDAVGNILGVEQSTVMPDPPRISGISPGLAAEGSVAAVVITGTNLTNSSLTTDNPGIAVTGVHTSDTTIRATFSVPLSVPEGPVTVSVRNIFGSAAIGFTIVAAPPTISALNPTQGPVSRLVRIAGSGFSSVPSENTVTFNGVAAQVHSSSRTGILTSVPAGAATGPVTVQVRGSPPSNEKTFQVTAAPASPPVITSISPNVGSVEGGCSVTISGSGFTTDTVVYFGQETVAGSTLISTSTINITTRCGSAGKYDVLATNANGDSFVQGGYTYLDATRLTIVSVSPALSSTGAPLNSPISALFSRSVDPATVDAAGFSLTEKASGIPVAGGFSFGFDNAEAIFKPTTALKPGTTYAIRLTTGVRSADGMPLDQPLSGTFVSGKSTDTTPPEVVITPPDGAIGMPVNALVTFVFTKRMNATTINASSITVSNNDSPVTGKISLNEANTIAVFTPYSKFLPSSSVKVVLSGKAADVAGNPIVGNEGPGSDIVARFTTSATSSLTPPRVLGVAPADGSSGASVYTAVSVIFDKPINPLMATSNSFVVKSSDSVARTGDVTLSNNYTTATFAAVEPFPVSDRMTVSVKGVSDMAGNAMPVSFTSSFTTQEERSPKMIAVSPQNWQGNIPLNSHMTISFDKRIDIATVDASSFYVTVGETERISGSISFSPDGRLAAFKPVQQLSPETGYYLNYTDSIKDLAGYSIVNPGSSYFITGNNVVDSTPPEIVAISPPIGAKNVPLNAVVDIKFSEPVDRTGVNGNSILVSHGGTPIPGDYSFDQDDSVVRYRLPDSVTFAPASFHQVTVTTSIADLVGNELKRDHVIGFTTGEVTDIDRPEVVSVMPADGATDILPDASIEVTFTDAVNPVRLTDSTFILRRSMSRLAYNDYSLDAISVMSTPINLPEAGRFEVSSDGKKVTFTPDFPLLAGSWEYSIELWNIEDLSSNMLSRKTYHFVTGLSPGTDIDALPAAATITVNPETMPADGVATSSIQISGIVDKNGNQVADGTKIAVRAMTIYRSNSERGTILEGTESGSYPGCKFFTTAGGEASMTYQAPDIPDLVPGETAHGDIRVFSVDAGEKLVERIAETSVELAN